MSAGAAGAPRVAAVSGASSGIGRAAALAFGARGWRVALGARREGPLREAAEAVRRAGGTALARSLDVGDAAAVDAFYAEAEAELGPVDLVVNCAAHARPGPLHELSAEEIRSELETGLLGALLFSRRAIRGLLARGLPGDVIFVSSTAAAAPWPQLATYAASKAGLEQAARSLSLELEGRGIRCLIVRVGNTGGTGWAQGWSPAELELLAGWGHFGLLRHGGLLAPERVAQAIAAAASAPRGVALDFVSVHPEAPVAAGGRSAGESGA